MEIDYHYDEDLLSSKADALVNTVNTVGVMGKGVALSFKEHFPEMFEDYRRKCQEKLIQIGQLDVYRNSDPIVINFPTKVHWKEPSKIDYIERGLDYFVRNYKLWEIKSVAFPQLGCGQGGLQWIDVKPVMERYLTPLEIKVEIYVDQKREDWRELESYCAQLRPEDVRKILDLAKSFINVNGGLPAKSTIKSRKKSLQKGVPKQKKTRGNKKIKDKTAEEPDPNQTHLFE